MGELKKILKRLKPVEYLREVAKCLETLERNSYDCMVRLEWAFAEFKYRAERKEIPEEIARQILSTLDYYHKEITECRTKIIDLKKAFSESVKEIEEKLAK